MTRRSTWCRGNWWPWGRRSQALRPSSGPFQEFSWRWRPQDRTLTPKRRGRRRGCAGAAGAREAGRSWNWSGPWRSLLSLAQWAVEAVAAWSWPRRCRSTRCPSSSCSPGWGPPVSPGTSTCCWAGLALGLCPPTSGRAAPCPSCLGLPRLRLRACGSPSGGPRRSRRILAGRRQRCFRLTRPGRRTRRLSFAAAAPECGVQCC